MDPLVASMSSSSEKPKIPFGYKDNALKYKPYQKDIIIDPEDLLAKEIEANTLRAEKEIEKNYPRLADGTRKGLFDDENEMDDDSVPKVLSEYEEDLKSLKMLGIYKTNEKESQELLANECQLVESDGTHSEYMSSLEEYMEDFNLNISESSKATEGDKERLKDIERMIAILSDPIHSVEHWEAFDAFHSRKLHSSSIMEHFEEEKERQEEEGRKTEAAESSDVDMITERVVQMAESVGHDSDKVRDTIKLILEQADSGLLSDINVENQIDEADEKMEDRKNEMLSRMHYSHSVSNDDE
mmetsp:Transcript_12868/g.19373  ORF Transcript_12868/g.19373 Transcript_12868/m.19373 type:complete len:299 (-) Transcript_12868:55-951(-)